ncbi:MAG TPA: TetR/AcrR family transcriptional regulator [Vicinamibacterales bacterium]|jgi:AcrR family transcriptional regulator
MNQEERTQKSRAQILEAALRLFSHQGYRATTVRDIAEAAGVSTGNVYHHFKEKETIFHQLLDQYWEAIASPEFPVNRALASGAFPDNLEEVGNASRESVQQWRQHVALIYVDVVEFDGKHIRKFYKDMAHRYESFLVHHRDHLRLDEKLRPGVSPVAAVMLVSRMFLHYFSIEIVFGVPNHFGRSSDQLIAEVSDMLRYGILRRPTEKEASC